MSCIRNIFIYLIFAVVRKDKIVAAEWVEIPQFSDGAKVYRVPMTRPGQNTALPMTKYVRGEKYFLENQGAPATHSFPNTSAIDDGFRRIKIHQQSTVNRTPMPSLSSNINLSSSPVTQEIVHKFENTELTVTESSQKIEDVSKDTDFDDEAATVEVEDEQIDVPTISSSDEIAVDKDEFYQTVPSTTGPQQAEEAVEGEDDPKASFMAYMPLELFKKVHATLKSQPSTVKGKLGFLKRFEITLLAEIEKQLVPVISPVRRKRESRGDHGWDDHEDSLGFPSLEGSLMAISFLTFAVYLVQLVMMLFRNLGNPTNPAGTATFLVNRNKRFVEEFTEDTARVFDHLDKFNESQFTEN